MNGKSDHVQAIRVTMKSSVCHGIDSASLWNCPKARNNVLHNNIPFIGVLILMSNTSGTQSQSDLPTVKARANHLHHFNL